MVYRVYVEKKPALRSEAAALLSDIRDFLRIGGLTGLRLVNRYDVENVDSELFHTAVRNVFSEPQLDDVSFETPEGKYVLAVEYLPGQFDQRADSAAQCIQIISRGERPTVRTAKLYLLDGELSDGDMDAIKHYLINPVEAREASLDNYATLASAPPVPEDVRSIDGLTSMDGAGLAAVLEEYGLAMDLGDLACLRDYFALEGRDPTVTELRMVDTYWSDHCRHTTFGTVIENIEFEDETLRSAWEDYLDIRHELGRDAKPLTLMDLGTIGAKKLKADGVLTALDESDEINACTVKVKVEVDGQPQDWLLLFKNETHNHPTEIEPFGGAATCIGGAIRDPLSGRAYVYGAMRVTGAADPTRPVSETIPGKLPQRQIVTSAAGGYSSYGNQIGLATGQVSELYHPGYAAKRMEIGAVVGAVPAANVRREKPDPGDVVILLGGRTGRDGIGGATGSSKSHNVKSLATMASEVQKGNAPEERKLQRLFRNAEVARLIRKCNDFGAGGVSVAIGELADGLIIDLDKVPKKYEGLDGTELAISESQERMAVVVAPGDAERFMEIARGENLEATLVAVVTEAPRLVMRWRGRVVADISREFLDSNGAKKYISITPAVPQPFGRPAPADFAAGMTALAGDLNICSQRGLSERFDSTIGAGTVLMPFGGSRQLTPAQGMINKVSMTEGQTDDASCMAWGFNPYISEKSPYHGAYLAVVESVSKLAACGAASGDVWLSFQEYFEKPLRDGKRWGKPLSALLGALRAQLDLGAAAIGGKDSMSGSFEKLDVPPTLVSFAVRMCRASQAVSPEFKKAGSRVFWLRPEYGADGLPSAASLKAVYAQLDGLLRSGSVLAAYTPGFGGAAEAVMKMCMGNGFGFAFEPGVSLSELFGYSYGSFILELADGAKAGAPLGAVTAQRRLTLDGVSVDMTTLEEIYENKLESVYKCNIAAQTGTVPAFEYYGLERFAAPVKAARPLALIPVFPGTNCEYDSARAMREAGAEAEIIVVNNLSAASIGESVEYFAKRLAQAQMVFIPGGFSGGDEPEGSAKFITAFFRNKAVKDGVHELLKTRGGLMCGVCNGFQALIKLGLVPFGEIIETDDACPTLSFNTIGRHQSRIVRLRIASNSSPWLMETEPGQVYMAPISHGEGRFLADEGLIKQLASRGQIATQYADESGAPTMDIRCNPNGSVFAVEGITSPDGRVLGKMGHSERIGAGLYRNVPGNYDMGLFRSAVRYFK